VVSSIADADRGMIRIQSEHSVGVTIDRLESQLKQRGILVFARVDFSADAARAGLTLRPEQLLIFGNPKAGTPLLQAAASAGLDLPFKALAWEDAQGRTWLAYNDPQYLVHRHGLASNLSAHLAPLVPLLEAAAQR